MLRTCPGRYADETTGRSIPCQWTHDPEGLHHAHHDTRCIMWVGDDAAAINSAAACPQPPVEERIEYGYMVEYADGDSCFMGFLGDIDRDRALGQFRAIEADSGPDGGPEVKRLVFVSRRITQTPWTEDTR